MHQDSFPHFDDPVIFEVRPPPTSVSLTPPLQTFRLVVKLVVLLLVFTGFVHSLSHLSHEMFFVTTDSSGKRGELTWHRSLYFIVVTITTVGYGDIFPSESDDISTCTDSLLLPCPPPVAFFSQAIILVIIAVSFVILPILASAFVQSLYARPEYAGSLSLPTGCAHVCLLGRVDPLMLNQLLAEFAWASSDGEGGVSDLLYSSDERSQYTVDPVKLCRVAHPVLNTIIVLLSPGPPSADLKKILFSSEAHTRRVVYFSGSCKIAADLERVQAQRALAIIVLSTRGTSFLSLIHLLFAQVMTRPTH
jgi:hypothetical protein